MAYELIKMFDIEFTKETQDSNASKVRCADVAGNLGAVGCIDFIELSSPADISGRALGQIPLALADLEEVKQRVETAFPNVFVFFEIPLGFEVGAGIAKLRTAVLDKVGQGVQP